MTTKPKCRIPNCDDDVFTYIEGTYGDLCDVHCDEVCDYKGCCVECDGSGYIDYDTALAYVIRKAEGND